MKIKKLSLVCLLVLACCLLPSAAVAIKSEASAAATEMQLRAAAESLMAQTTNVSASKDVAKIWQYVDYLVEKDRQNDARQYIEAGLSFEPFNYYYQARLALIMAGNGFNGEAFDRASIVYDKSEDAEAIEMVLPLLKRSAVAPFKPIDKFGFASLTVVLVTIGEVDRLLLQELKHKIVEYFGLEVVICSEFGTPPPSDRSFFTSEIKRMRETILTTPEIATWLEASAVDTDRLRSDNELFFKTMEEFLKQNNPIAAKGFKKNMDLARLRHQQWSYDSLRDYLINMAAPYRSEKWLLVGVTSYDMYMADTNYVFAGANPYGQAIISYRRFMGNFNNEPQNRKRLLSRLFKQFLSVFGLLNGMTRCTFPDCARVFPRNLAEHDEKPEYLCDDCRLALEKLLKIKIQAKPTHR